MPFHMFCISEREAIETCEDVSHRIDEQRLLINTDSAMGCVNMLFSSIENDKTVKREITLYIRLCESRQDNKNKLDDTSSCTEFLIFISLRVIKVLAY